MPTAERKNPAGLKWRERARVLPRTDIPRRIPPKSVVLLQSFDATMSPEWSDDIGRIFRVGFYNRNDGLDCIWLVNEKGEYEQTTDRSSLLKHFLILKISTEKDLFGDKRPPLRPIKGRSSSGYRAASLLG